MSRALNQEKTLEQVNEDIKSGIDRKKQWAVILTNEPSRQMLLTCISEDIGISTYLERAVHAYQNSQLNGIVMELEPHQRKNLDRIASIVGVNREAVVRMFLNWGLADFCEYLENREVATRRVIKLLSSASPEPAKKQWTPSEN